MYNRELLKVLMFLNSHPKTYFDFYVDQLLSADSLAKLKKISLSSLTAQMALEPVCCKKRKKSPNQVTGLGNRDNLEALDDTKLILNDKRSHSC